MEIVLIDDDATGVFLTTWLLEKEGLAAKLTSFVSPTEGLAYLKQQALAGRPPRVVLLDLNMPLLSGWEVLNALRPLEEQLQGRCQVYVLTSSLASADTVRSGEYPLVAGLVNKPLNREKILAIQARSQAAG